MLGIAPSLGKTSHIFFVSLLRAFSIRRDSRDCRLMVVEPTKWKGQSERATERERSEVGESDRVLAYHVCVDTRKMTSMHVT